jgi:hypothetical protein
VRVDQAGQHRATVRVEDLIGWLGRPADRHDAAVGDIHRPVTEAVRHTVEYRSINDRQGTHGRRLAGCSPAPAAAPAATPRQVRQQSALARPKAPVRQQARLVLFWLA